MHRSSFELAVAAVVAVLTLATPVTAQSQGGPPLEIFYGFNLIDGTGAPPVPDAAIAVRGNEILTISSRRQLLSGPNAPRDAIITDLGGGWVLPGLIDTHVHLSTAPNRGAAERELQRLLYGGVVAVRDMAGDARALASLARDTRLGQLDGPDVFFSALMAGPSFFTDPRPQASAAGETPGQVAWMQAITPETDIVRAVARAKGTYATGIKIYANLEPDLVRAITEEAHRQDMRVWAHSMVFPTRPMAVVESGVDVISHVCRLAWEGMAESPSEYHHDQVPRYGSFSIDSPVFNELFEEMRDRGTVLDATLAMYARGSGDPDDEPSDRCDPAFARRLVARAHEHGIPIVAGTDFAASRGDPFPAIYQEMKELAENGGLGAMGAIEAATRVAAEAIGIDGTHGVLAHGRPVSFVLLAESPLEDLDHLRTVKAVWKNGERFDRSGYRPPATEDEVDTTPVSGAASTREALDLWVGLWRHLNADRLAEVFLQDPALTYFAPDREGAIEGYPAVLAYHEEQGFVSGGARPDRELWIEDVLITDFEDSAVVTAIWHLGNRLTRENLSRGPLTVVVERTRTGYRVSHVNMANYPLAR